MVDQSNKKYRQISVAEKKLALNYEVQTLTTILPNIRIVRLSNSLDDTTLEHDLFKHLQVILSLVLNCIVYGTIDIRRCHKCNGCSHAMKYCKSKTSSSVCLLEQEVKDCQNNGNPEGNNCANLKKKLIFLPIIQNGTM